MASNNKKSEIETETELITPTKRTFSRLFSVESTVSNFTSKSVHYDFPALHQYSFCSKQILFKLLQLVGIY